MKDRKSKKTWLIVIHDVASGIKNRVYEHLIVGTEYEAEHFVEQYNGKKMKAFRALLAIDVDNVCIDEPKKVKWWKRLWQHLTGDMHRWWYVNVVHDNLDEENFINDIYFESWEDAMKHREQLMFKENFDYVGTVAVWTDYPLYEWKLPEGATNWE